MKKCIIGLFTLLLVCSFKPLKDKEMISNSLQKTIVDSLVAKNGNEARMRAERGVAQVAQLWVVNDGTDKEFADFCQKNFIGKSTDLDLIFNNLSNKLEILNGNFNRITLGLRRNVDEKGIELQAIDEMFASYDVSAHFNDDMFSSKIAFVIALNFPHFSLEEKEKLGPQWTRKEWAFARIGDMFTSRVPAGISQNITKVMSEADMYIADYNIYAGSLLDDKGKTLFPKDMVLLSHWNIRDEIKSNYANKDGLVKQRLLYQVMKHIVAQDIPENVINSSAYQWNPYSNKAFEKGKEVSLKSEPNTRYEHLLATYKAMKAADPYYTELNTYIKRAFDGSMEVRTAEIEKLFDEVLRSPEMGKVASLITKRLNRNLEPFDIWYDGFKSRSTIDGAALDKQTQAKYADNKAFKQNMPVLLQQLGWQADRAQFIASKIEVDAARGSGHAWGTQMKDDASHLRTRIGDKGMDYKGYNIAVHEFGHNVEQTISIHDVDYYVLRGVPSTAFTEALAFLFQAKDLELLGIQNNAPDATDLKSLDIFWSTCEIMGVSLVDINVWKWMYAHPEATSAELNKAVNEIAIGIWNKYFAPVYGVKDQPLLAIYSHMISNPLYLSNYAFGHLIDFQVGSFVEGKVFANEVDRMYKTGCIIPQEWMKQAVGSPISTKPLLEAVNKALLKM
jgi:hypothetical protein